MKTRSVVQDIPEYTGFVWLPLGDWTPPDEAPGPVPDWHRSPSLEQVFEAYDGPNPTDGNTWTRFTHYKRVMGEATGLLRLPRIMGAWPNSHKRQWIAILPTYYGWTKHHGFAPALQDLPMFVPGVISGDFVSLPGNLSTEVSRAISAMMPAVKAELSLVNSVLELKDFKGLVLKARKSYERFRFLTAHLPKRFWGRQVIGDLKSGWVKYLAGLRKASKSELAARGASAAASSFLQWKFAIAPLISDVRAVRSALAKLEKTVNRLLTNEGRVRTSHWTDYTTSPGKSGSYSFGHGPGLGQPEVVKYSPDCSGEFVYEVSDTRTRIHVQMKYNYNFTEYQREHAHILALMDSFGIQSNPAIIWNAIRFTFILDWVIGVGRYLDQFKVANMEPKINVLGALWSCTSERFVQSYKTYDANGMYCSTKVSLPVLKETGYTRRLFRPSLSSLTASGLSPLELTLGAALVFASRRRKATVK
jgi:hypothetical protein